MRIPILYILFFLLSGFTFSQQFTPDTAGCTPFLMPLNSSVSNYDSLIWDFGNGAFSNLETPTALYTTSGDYEVNLYVDYGNGVFDTISKVYSIRVIPNPIANFDLTQFGACQNEVLVSFQQNAEYYDSLFWDFGDGNHSTEMNPEHLFTSSGTFFPVLTAKNNFGCFHQFSFDSVVVRPLPVFQLNQTLSSNCSQIDSLELLISGDFTTLNVDINGDIYSSSPINIQDLGEDSDSIVVWGTNQYGCSDTVYFSQIFSGNSSSGVSFDINGGNICASQQAIIMMESSVGVIDSVRWMVDGAFVSDSLILLYTASGAQSQTVTAQVYLESGCMITRDTLLTPLASSFYNGLIVLDSIICADENTEIYLTNNQYDHIEWFVNSQPFSNDDTLVFSTSLFDYQLIQVAVYDTNQCMTLLSDSIYVPQVEADVFLFNATGCSPLTTTFMSIGLGGDQFVWDFGEGTTGTGTPVQHTYQNGGFYSIKLIASSSVYGCSDTLFLEDRITVYSNDIIFDTLMIEACGSYDLEIQNFNIGNDFWFWDYGDGSTSNGQNASHTYNEPGIYSVTLTTNSVSGCQINVEGIASIVVKATEEPDIEFTLDCPNAEVYLNNSSSNQINWGVNGINQTISDTLNLSAWDFASGNVLISYSYTDSVGCLVDENVYLMLNCPDSSGVSAPMVSDGNNPGISQSDTITICIDEGVGFQFIQLPPAYTLISFSPAPGVNLSTIPSLYNFPQGGYYQPTFEVDGPNGQETLILNRIYQVVDYQSNFNVSIAPLSCDSLYLVLEDTINTNNHVYWEVVGLGAWNAASVQVPVINQDFNYSITYKLLDQYSCGLQLNQTITFSKIDYVANFTDEICLGDPANYYTNLSSSSYPHLWDFGDGNSSTSYSGFYNYSNQGVFYPKLILDDLFGCIDTVRFDSIVVSSPENTIEGLPDMVCMSDTFEITAGNDQVNCKWYLNDILIGTTPVLEFVLPFSYDSDTIIIRLESEINGCTHSVSDTVISYSPQFGYSYGQDRKCLPTSFSTIVYAPSSSTIEWLFSSTSSSIMASNSDTTYMVNTEEERIDGLRITDSLGCDHQVNFLPFNVWTQEYQVSTSEGCSPLVVEFTPPENAVQFSWDFGSLAGGVSNDSLLIKTFVDTGIYHLTASFVMDDDCVISFNDSNIVLVHSIYAEPNLEVLNVCAPATVEFSLDSMYNIDFYNWNYGDGANSSIVNSNHTYVNGGVYYPELYVSNNFGCTDTIILSDSVFVGGGAPTILLSDSLLCTSDSTHFFLENSELYGDFQWVLGDGALYSDSSFYHTFDLNGTYSVLVLVEDTLGCASSLDGFDVSVYSSPNIIFDLLDSVYCQGETLSLDINNPDSHLITWELNSQPFTIIEPLAFSGDLLLVGTANIGSCSTTIQDSLQVIFPQNSSLISDSVFCQSDSSVILEMDISGGFWFGDIIRDSVSGEIDISTSITDTIIYRFNDECSSETQVMIQVDSLLNPAFYLDQSHCYGEVDLNLLPTTLNGSWFVEGDQLSSVNLNTLSVGSYQIVYELQNGLCSSRDTSGFYINQVGELNAAVSDSIFCHGEQVDVFVSNPMNYAFELYAVSLNGDSIQDIVQLSNSPGYYDIYYKVEDTNQCSATYFIDHILILDPNTPNSVNVIRSTVVDDKMIYSEWIIDSSDYIKILDLNIYRSIKDQDNWSLIDRVPKSWNFYEDYSVEVIDLAYEYRIIPNFHCTWDALPGESNSINLKVEEDGTIQKLKWNAYDKWDSGVDHYEIQILVNGEWQTIQIVQPNILQWIIP